MSSATSTDAVRLPSSPNSGFGATRPASPQSAPDPSGHAGAPPEQSLQPWQFFVLAALICATVATFLARGQGPAAVVLLSIMMGTAALIGMAVLRVLRPLIGTADDRTVMIGERTRAALEREKMLALRAIKELEFDRAMGKLSDADWQEMSGRLRTRAARLMRQLDARGGYREQIERDLQRWIGSTVVDADAGAAVRPCGSCATVNDADAKFCKGCGSKL